MFRFSLIAVSLEGKSDIRAMLYVPRLASLSVGGGRVVQWCWANLQCWGVLLIWIRVEQRPSVLAVGAGGGCLDIFLSSIISLSFSLCLGDGPIQTEILSKKGR